MRERRLAPEERAAWARLRASVRPLTAPAAGTIESAPAAAAEAAPVVMRPSSLLPKRQAHPQAAAPAMRAAGPGVGTTLDGGWDRRLLRGAVAPDRTIDLHGHNLSTAHARLDLELERAVAHGDRVLLVVTGRPPRAGSERPHSRGAIRASIADWLAFSRHAGAVAAVRGAHPRHGGAGALYVILRRAR